MNILQRLYKKMFGSNDYQECCEGVKDETIIILATKPPFNNESQYPLYSVWAVRNASKWTQWPHTLYMNVNGKNGKKKWYTYLKVKNNGNK